MSTRTRPASQVVLIGAGALAGLYGVVLLLGRGPDNLVATVVWLGGGVVLHDAVLAPLTIGVALLGVRLLPAAARPWSAAVGIVVGTLTIVAIPVLGRFGARADNPSLLPRDYVGGWLLVVALVVLAVGALAGLEAARGRRGRAGDGGTRLVDRDDRALDDDRA